MATPEETGSRPARAGKDRIITHPIGHETGWTTHDHWAKLGQIRYTRSKYAFVVIALFSMKFIAPASRKIALKEGSAGVLRVEEGTGEAVLDGVRTAIRAGFAVVVPAGANHNIINTGNVPLKLYTLYAPPNHRDGVIHHTRDDAAADNKHFDGKTTE